MGEEQSHLKRFHTLLSFTIILGIFILPISCGDDDKDIPVLTWEKTLGGTNGGVGRSVQQTSDGGYIIAGWTFSCSEGALDHDVYLMKTDAHGNVLWEKTFRDGDYGNSVQQTSDGGYIILGGTGFAFSGKENYVYLIKTDAEGNAEWERTFRNAESNSGYSVQQTSDGGYIIAGKTGPPRSLSEEMDVYLIKTDADGNDVWEKTFGDVEIDSGYSVQQTLDGGYIIAGYKGWYHCDGRDISGDDVYLIKTDTDGNIKQTITE